MGAVARFCFFALGGVIDNNESSSRCEGTSSSVSSLERFFKAVGFGFRFVSAVFLEDAFGIVAFLGAVFGATLVLVIGFYHKVRN